MRRQKFAVISIIMICLAFVWAIDATKRAKFRRLVAEQNEQYEQRRREGQERIRNQEEAKRTKLNETRETLSAIKDQLLALKDTFSSRDSIPSRPLINSPVLLVDRAMHLTQPTTFVRGFKTCSQTSQDGLCGGHFG